MPKHNSMDVHCNPLDDPTYLRSPIETIAFSVYQASNTVLSPHDVTDAYATLAFRIRSSIIPHMSEAHTSPALQSLKDEKSRIIKALQRDMQQAWWLPLFQPSQGLSLGLSNDGSALSPEEEKKHTLDMYMLCQYALKIVADIFNFGALHALFSHNELCDLLADLLSLVTCGDSLFGAKNIRNWAIWTLTSQSLPHEIILAKRNELTTTLRRVLDTRDYLSNNPLLINDTLRAVSNLMGRGLDGPRMTALAGVLPSILPLLASEHSSIRHHTCITVGLFALTVVRNAPLHQPSFSGISSHTKSYLLSQIKDEIEHLRLADVFKTILREKSSTPCASGDGVIWMLSVLSSFIIMLGKDLWRETLVTFIFGNLEDISHPRGFIAEHAHPFAWRCAIWAFARLREALRTSGAETHLYGRSKESQLDRTVKILAIELKQDIGNALTGMLLGYRHPESPQVESTIWDVTKALEVVQCMLEHERHPIQKKGSALLSRLLSGVDQSGSESSSLPPWTYDALVDLTVINGRMLTVEEPDLPFFIRNMPPVDVSDVRILFEEEVRRHWEMLASLWMISMKQHLNAGLKSDKLNSDLRTWKAILLARIQRMEGDAEFAAFQVHICGMIKSFIPSDSDAEIQIQVHSLRIMKSLWDVATSVLHKERSTSIAAAMLSAILSHEFDLEHDGVKTAWCAVCADIFLAGLPQTGEEFSEQHESVGWNKRRLMWRDVARNRAGLPTRMTWQDWIYFLVLPLGSAALTEEELQLWGEVLQWAVSIGSAASIKASVVVDTLFDRYSPGSPRFSIPVALSLVRPVIRGLHLEEPQPIPVKALRFIRDVLSQAYITHPYNPHAVDIFERLHQNLFFVAPQNLEYILFSLQDGLIPWIKDEKEVVLEMDYNDKVLEVYKTILERLSYHTVSMKLIQDLTHFLTSAFHRIPAPAKGPKAFKTFFDEVYRCLGEHGSAFPVDLQPCVAVSYQFFGGDIPDGMESQSDSQHESQVQMHRSSSPPPPGQQPPAPQPDSIMSTSSPWQAATNVQPVISFSSTKGQSWSGIDAGRPANQQSKSGQDTPFAASPSRTHGKPILSSEIPSDRPGPSALPAPKRRRVEEPHNHTSAPISRVSSPIPNSERSRSTPQDTRSKGKGRMVMDYVEIVQRPKGRPTTHKDESPPTSRTAQSPERKASNTQVQEDYDEWELTVESPVARRIMNELTIVPETPQGDDPARLGRRHLDIRPDREGSPVALVKRTKRARSPSHIESIQRFRNRPEDHVPPRLTDENDPPAADPLLRRSHTTPAYLEMLRRTMEVLPLGESQETESQVLEGMELAEAVSAAMNRKARKRQKTGG
ncbi:hypothetical protein OF83DRAFT_1289426 [Amylostereum chailletii]|nr:hypothetical protein OF83DRAFT_1289426 [Amylostereum chailletii]